MYMMASIDPRVAALAPDFRAIIMVLEAGERLVGSVADQALNETYRVISRDEPSWGEAHLEAWAQVFRRFDAKPQRTSCSAEALRKRGLRDGLLPRLNPVVDLYNAISLRFALPVGGEDLDAYIGQPRLTITTGSEIFETMKDGQAVEEPPEPGEAVWRDDRGVTCRRWNRRQGPNPTGYRRPPNVVHLGKLDPNADRSLHKTRAELGEGLRAMMPDARVQTSFLVARGTGSD